MTTSSPTLVQRQNTDLSVIRPKRSGFRRQISPLLFDLSFHDVLQEGGVDECILRLWKHCQSLSPDSVGFQAIADALRVDLSMNAEELAALKKSFQKLDSVNFLEFWQVVENDVLIARDLVDLSADHAHLQDIRIFRDHVLRLATADGVDVVELQEVLTEIRQGSDDSDFWLRVGDAFPEENYISCQILADATHSWLMNDVDDREPEYEELQPGKSEGGATYAMSWSNLAGTPLDRLAVCVKLVSNIKDANEAGQADMVASIADALQRALVTVREKAEIDKDIQAEALTICQKLSLACLDARPLSMQIETASSHNDMLATKLASLGTPGSPSSCREPNSSKSAKTNHAFPAVLSPHQHDKMQEKVNKLKEKVEVMKTRLQEMKTKNKDLESQLHDRNKKVVATVDETRVKLQEELENARQETLKHAELHNHTVEAVKAKLALVENQNACLETRFAALTKQHTELKRKYDKPEEDNVNDDAFATFLGRAERSTKKQTIRELQDKVEHLEEYIQHLHDKNNTDAVDAIYEEGEDDVYVNSRIRQLKRRIHFLHVQGTTLQKYVLEIEKDSRASAEMQNLAALMQASLDDQNSINHDLTASLRTETVIKEDLQKEVLRLQVRTETLQSDLASAEKKSHACSDHPSSNAAVSDFLPAATVLYKAESVRSTGLHSAQDTEIATVKTRRKAAEGVETVQVSGKAVHGGRVTAEGSSRPFSATKKYKTRPQCSKNLTMTFDGGVEVNNMLTTGSREDAIVARRKGPTGLRRKMAVIGEKDDAEV